MKQRKIIPFYSGIYVLTLAFGVLCLGLSAYILFFINTVPFTTSDVIYIGIMFCVCVFLIATSLYYIIHGFSSGTYSIDAEGMTAYVGKKTYRLEWTECVEFGIAGVKVNWGSSIVIVYCTTKLTTAHERDRFLACRKNDYENTLYFQYTDPESFQEFLDAVPELAKAQLVAKALQFHLI